MVPLLHTYRKNTWQLISIFENAVIEIRKLGETGVNIEDTEPDMRGLDPDGAVGAVGIFRTKLELEPTEAMEEQKRISARSILAFEGAIHGIQFMKFHGYVLAKNKTIQTF